MIAGPGETTSSIANPLDETGFIEDPLRRTFHACLIMVAWRFNGQSRKDSSLNVY
jgi:hypothetical protein